MHPLGSRETADNIGAVQKSRIAPFAIVYFGKKNYLTVAKKQTL